jgi:hypothetical protein
MHPIAVARLHDHDIQRVYWPFEGCLKGDAALVEILDTDEPSTVFTTPSVSLWDADSPKVPQELQRFAEAKLRGKEVPIVPDSDADQNGQVMYAAFLAREKLRGWGINAVVALPPAATCEKHGPGTKANGKHGLDDMLGPCTNGTLGDLVRIDRTPPTLEEVTAWKAEAGFRQSGQFEEGNERDHAVLRILSLICDSKGRTQIALSTLTELAFPDEYAKAVEEDKVEARKKLGAGELRRQAIKAVRASARRMSPQEFTAMVESAEDAILKRTTGKKVGALQRKTSRCFWDSKKKTEGPLIQIGAVALDAPLVVRRNHWRGKKGMRWQDGPTITLLRRGTETRTRLGKVERIPTEWDARTKFDAAPVATA